MEIRNQERDDDQEERVDDEPERTEREDDEGEREEGDDRSQRGVDQTQDQRRDYKLIGGGAGIWWETLDDGISVPRLFGLPEDL